MHESLDTERSYRYGGGDGKDDMTNCVDGNCAMCQAQARWNPITPPTEHWRIAETVMAGALFAFSAWGAVWLFWSIGNWIFTHNLGLPTLIITTLSGAGMGLYASTTGRR